MTTLTAASKPSTSAAHLVKKCSKCKGTGRGDFGLYERNAPCLACDQGLTFTPAAFAKVTELRIVRTLDAIKAQAETLKNSDIAATLVAQGCTPTAISIQGETVRRDQQLAQLRADFAMNLRYLRGARSVIDATSLTTVRAAIWGEDGRFYKAK